MLPLPDGLQQLVSLHLSSCDGAYLPLPGISLAFFRRRSKKFNTSGNILKDLLSAPSVF
jgi:hypothetical protein